MNVAARGDRRAPFLRAHIPNMAREEPGMAFKIFDSVLPFAVECLVEILQNLDAGRLRAFEVRIHVLHEHSEALGVASELRRGGAARPRAPEHDPGVAQMHLRAVDSPRLTRDVAVLVGHHDVPVRSVSVGDGRASEQISWQRRLILEAADIRSIERGSALLLASGIRPALLDLRPWTTRPDAARIDAARLRAEAAIQRAAQAGAPGSLPASGSWGHPHAHTAGTAS